MNYKVNVIKYNKEEREVARTTFESENKDSALAKAKELAEELVAKYNASHKTGLSMKVEDTDIYLYRNSFPFGLKYCVGLSH